MRHYVYEIVNKVEGIGRYTHPVDLPDDAPAPPNSSPFEPKLSEHLDTYFNGIGWQWGPKYEDITDQHVWGAFVNRINGEAARMITQAAGDNHNVIVQTWPLLAGEARLVVEGKQSSAISTMCKADGRGLTELEYATEFLKRYNAYVLRVAQVTAARESLLRQTKVEDLPRITRGILIG